MNVLTIVRRIALTQSCPGRGPWDKTVLHAMWIHGYPVVEIAAQLNRTVDAIYLQRSEQQAADIGQYKRRVMARKNGRDRSVGTHSSSAC